MITGLLLRAVRLHVHTWAHARLTDPIALQKSTKSILLKLHFALITLSNILDNRHAVFRYTSVFLVLISSARWSYAKIMHITKLVLSCVAAFTQQHDCLSHHPKIYS